MFRVQNFINSTKQQTMHLSIFPYYRVGGITLSPKSKIKKIKSSQQQICNIAGISNFKVQHT